MSALFRKIHGLGNDYLVAEKLDGLELSPELIRAICHRHTGLGGDGILEPVESTTNAYGLRIHNPDGSEAEKSGNGLRIFAYWLVTRRGAPAEFQIETISGSVACEVDGTTVSVEMGTASAEPKDVPIDHPEAFVDQELPGLGGLRATAVGIGNPHCVLFFDDDLDTLPWQQWGPMIESHSLFPNRTNVQFAQILKQDRIALRIWERGAGETAASGSSASAVCAAAVGQGLCDPGRITAEMPGGDLEVWVSETGAVRIRGPVEEVGPLELSDQWLEKRLRISQ